MGFAEGARPVRQVVVRPTRQHDVDCPAPNPVERILKGVDAKVVTAGDIDLHRGRTAAVGERR
jgi:hypothetical protein